MSRTPLAALALAVSLAAPAAASASVTAAAPDAASLLPAVQAFRTPLGIELPNNGLSFPSGRREVNWDGVPDQFASPHELPADFFSINSPRGIRLGGAPSLRVSSTLASGVPVRFGDLSPNAASHFLPFSSQRLFASPGSTTVEATFEVPGTRTPAATGAFGAVFTDVDRANTSAIEAFDATGALIERLAAPTRPGGLSFAAVTAPAGRPIASVRITQGTRALAAGVVESLPEHDIVALDDFIYAEPQALPPAPRPAPVPSPAPAPAGSPAPLPATAPAADATAPRLTRVVVRRGRLRFRLSEPARITVRIAGRRTLVRRAAAGANAVRLPRLAHRARLRLAARDAAGNRSATVRRTARPTR